MRLPLFGVSLGLFFVSPAATWAWDTAALFQLAPRVEEDDPWRVFPGPRKIRIETSFVVAEVGEGWGHPWTFGPDLWVGLSDRVSVGLVHSGYGSVGFYGLVPLGFCFDGETCDETYRNTGGRVLTKLGDGDGDFSLAADAGFLVSWAEPASSSVRAGILAHHREGWFFFEFNPAIHFGVNEREAGNTEELVVPVTFGFTLTPELKFDVQSGIWGRLDDLGESYFMPLNFGGWYEWNSHVAVGLRFSFPFLSAGSRLTGQFPDYQDPADFRGLEIYVSVGN